MLSRTFGHRCVYVKLGRGFSSRSGPVRHLYTRWGDPVGPRFRLLPLQVIGCGPALSKVSGLARGEVHWLGLEPGPPTRTAW